MPSQAVQERENQNLTVATGEVSVPYRAVITRKIATPWNCYAVSTTSDQLADAVAALGEQPFGAVGSTCRNERDAWA